LWYFVEKPRICFLSHNFGTKNVRKPIKGSKDSDYSLVSKQNLSQKTGLLGWSPGPGNLGQKMCKPMPIVTSPTKTQHPKLSNLKNLNYKTFPNP